MLYNNFLKGLAKRQAMLKIIHEKPKSPSTQLELEGVIEELRRDKKMYQKTAFLRLRPVFEYNRLLLHFLLCSRFKMQWQ